jgi:hypothetical protein
MISHKFHQIFTNFKQNLKNFIYNNSEPDNNCYLILDCTLEEVFKNIPQEIQEKILLLEYPYEKYSYTKEKDLISKVF